MKKPDQFKSRLKPGTVYRRADLSKLTNAVDRHLQILVKNGTLKKVAPGVYHYPKQTAFGNAPATEDSLVHNFLKDSRFLLTSPNLYNALGVGTTQLYNSRVVYNHKRRGNFRLGNRDFTFRIKAHFPRELTEEFLLVDLVDNLGKLGEERDVVLEKVKNKAKRMNSQKLKTAVRTYGGAKAKKLLLQEINDLS